MTVHELFLLHLGQLGSRDEATGEAHFNQVPGYLIRTATGQTVLVDTGNPRAMIGAETAEPWSRLLTITKPEDDIVPRLAELGIAPVGIDLLVSTHFDFDHCGRHDVFAAVGTESVVQRRHLAAARKERRYDAALWELPGLRYREVDGDVELESGLRLLATSGHAIGHQSVYVETADGPVILAVDAISHGDTIATREIPDWYSDVKEAEQSMDRLVALANETGAYLVFGHDAPQWDTLPKSPCAVPATVNGEIAMTASRVVDLSHPIDAGVPMFPGHPQPALEEFLSREASERNYAPGTSFVIHRYSFLGNTGAYLDSPFHRFADGDDLASLDLAKTVDLPGVTIDARDRVRQGQLGVGAAEIGDLDVAGRAVLIATGWDRHWPSPAYLEQKPYLTGDGAELLRERGATLVGLDTWNIDDVADRSRPAHSILLRAGIPIVENLRGLNALPQSGFRFFAAPLPFRGGSAIPARAFALIEAS